MKRMLKKKKLLFCNHNVSSNYVNVLKTQDFDCKRYKYKIKEVILNLNWNYYLELMTYFSLKKIPKSVLLKMPIKL